VAAVATVAGGIIEVSIEVAVAPRRQRTRCSARSRRRSGRRSMRGGASNRPSEALEMVDVTLKCDHRGSKQLTTNERKREKRKKGKKKRKKEKKI
jgi:hypothetical protein